MKSRSEKSGSARKIRPQKGQGKARTSTIRSPQKRGGGRAIPKRQKDWSFKMSIKTRQLALKSALASKFAQNKVRH
jgi:large subunit ribosomal protein L4